MRYSQNCTDMKANKAEFIKFLDRRYVGSPVGRGWGIYPGLVCLECDFVWEDVQPIGTKGRTCPQCGHKISDFLWLGSDTPIGIDGPWLDPVGWRHFRLITDN